MAQLSTYTEKELLLLVAEGNEAAFKVLFDTYCDRIYINILHICKQPELAEDLTQEVFARIWLYRSKLSAVERFDAFLYQVSRHIVVDELRKKVFPWLNEDFFDVYFLDNSADGLAQLEQKEMQSVLLQAVNRLPSQLQRVFTLHRLEGLSHQQIADTLNISKVSS